MKALILTDRKPGHENQSVAFCKNTGIDYDLVEVSYSNKAAKALSYLLDRIGIYSDKLFTCSLPHVPCAMLISTGSTTFYPNKVLARKLGVPNIAILSPKGYRPDFTRVLCPAYDNPPKRNNVVELPLNLCAADPDFFEQKTAEFKTKYEQKKPAVGFIIGGPNAVSTIDVSELKKQLERAFELTEGYERWVTTSRRTPPAVEELIEATPFDYALINSRDSFNPVPAFIQLCDRLFVTSDSASMISETASFGSASVEILKNRQLKTPNKFERLFQGLEKENAVHVFDGTLGNASHKVDLTPMLREQLDSIQKKTAC
jgi:mitochondrial fission protein ELM1